MHRLVVVDFSTACRGETNDRHPQQRTGPLVLKRHHPRNIAQLSYLLPLTRKVAPDVVWERELPLYGSIYYHPHFEKT
jgi:hypothetical protein